MLMGLDAGSGGGRNIVPARALGVWCAVCAWGNAASRGFTVGVKL